VNTDAPARPSTRKPSEGSDARRCRTVDGQRRAGAAVSERDGRAGPQDGPSTTRAARSFCAKLDRAGGWENLSLARQADALGKARSFASWLLVTGQLVIAADLMTDLDLRLGVVARGHLPGPLRLVRRCRWPGAAKPFDVALQWNALMKAAAVTGVAADRLDDRDFDAARDAIVAAYLRRGMPSSGRNMSAIFHPAAADAVPLRSAGPAQTSRSQDADHHHRWADAPLSSPTPPAVTSPRWS
jgi:hypothetical protein